MDKSHNFNFEGGEILRSITAWWLVSYTYYEEVDKNHKNWEAKLKKSSVVTRKSKYNKSKHYHKQWLLEVLKMSDLDKHKNLGNLNGDEIKKMAELILKKKK